MGEMGKDNDALNEAGRIVRKATVDLAERLAEWQRLRAELLGAECIEKAAELFRDAQPEMTPDEANATVYVALTCALDGIGTFPPDWFMPTSGGDED